MEDEFGGDTKSEEELKAIDLSIVLQRINNDRYRIGIELREILGRAARTS